MTTKEHPCDLSPRRIEPVIPLKPASLRSVRSVVASSPPDISRLRVKVFADGADKAGMIEMAGKPHIAGLTTNPTLMRKAGISDYRSFAREVLALIPDKPISFEVFADDFAEMERQAHEIRSWGDNVFVKIPVTNTLAEPAYALVRRLAAAGVKQNVTALMTLHQVGEVSDALGGDVPAYVSVFAGRIADTGRDPVFDDGPSRAGPQAEPEPEADLGQPARVVQHLPGRLGRMSHHHRHQRRAEKAGPRRKRPGRILAGDRQDVPRRRQGGGVYPVVWKCGRP